MSLVSGFITPNRCWRWVKLSWGSGSGWSRLPALHKSLERGRELQQLQIRTAAHCADRNQADRIRCSSIRCDASSQWNRRGTVSPIPIVSSNRVGIGAIVEEWKKLVIELDEQQAEGIRVNRRGVLRQSSVGSYKFDTPHRSLRSTDILSITWATP